VKEKEMNEFIVYRPHKIMKWILLFILPAEIVTFAAIGFALCSSPDIGLLLFLLGMGIGFIWILKYVCDCVKCVVVFEQNGVHIVNDSRFVHRYIAWDSLTYGCYTGYYRGRNFLLLSSTALNHKEAKKLVIKESYSFSSRLCVNDAIIIPLAFDQDISQIEELVSKKVLHIETCD
jgi:hypothetical protein